MRTIDRLSPTAALPWLRARADGLRRALLDLRPAVRWGLVLAAAVGLAIAGCWAVIALAPAGSRFLASDRPLSSHDLIKVCRALHTKGIEYRIVEGRKVEVPADQYDQAAAVFTKLDLGLPPIDEIRGQVSPWSLLETRDEKARRDLVNQERLIESFLSPLKGVVSSVVSLKSIKKAGVLATSARLSAFVFVETEGNHQLPFQTVQSIVSTLLGCQPELTADSITVMDDRGRSYLEAGKPGLGELSRDRARAEEIQQQILEKLAWIKGVQVWVELTDQHADSPAMTAAPPAAAEPARGNAAPMIAVNQPLELHAQRPLDAPAPAVSAAPKSPTEARRAERGRILVYVPRSFYYHAVFPKADDREPSLEELDVLESQTEKKVRKAVDLVLLAPEHWMVTVERIPDEVPAESAGSRTAVSEARRKALDWAILATAGAGLVILAAVGSWIQVARRPARQPAPAPQTRRFHGDSSSEPGPSERVRELIHRDPEAAASVLQRWTTRGGRA
jgi:flagellar biosynthesis/type III secretory pathway M-ring protein FliF/YscJ